MVTTRAMAARDKQPSVNDSSIEARANDRGETSGSTDPTYAPTVSVDTSQTPSISSDSGGSEGSVTVSVGSSGSRVGSTVSSRASCVTPSVDAISHHPEPLLSGDGSETSRSITLGSETRSSSSPPTSLSGFIVADDDETLEAESRMAIEDGSATDEEDGIGLTLVNILARGPPPAPRKPGRRHPPPTGL